MSNETESGLGWVCTMWRDAMQKNTANGWMRVRDAMFGASQSLIFTSGNWEAFSAYQLFSGVAHQHELNAITEHYANREAA